MTILDVARDIPLSEAKALAKAGGYKKFHWRPCRACGATERYTSQGNCVACMIRVSTQFRAEHPEDARRSRREWFWRNKDKQAAYCKAYRERNPEKFQEYSRGATARAKARKAEYERIYLEQSKAAAERWWAANGPKPRLK